MTQAVAAEQLRISERWVRELIRRVRKRGDRVVVHGLQGKASSRRVDGKVRQRAVRICQNEYGDFGPTLAAEYLAGRHGIVISKESLRKWLIEAGVWRAKPRRIQEVHVWRPRRSCRGELVQWDTSIHDWLEGRSLEPIKLPTEECIGRTLGTEASGDSFTAVGSQTGKSCRRRVLRSKRDWIFFDSWTCPVSLSARVSN